MHQHAHDTSSHARSPGDAQVILDTSVDLHCAATGSKLQRGKSQVLGLGSLSHLAALEATTGVTFAAQGASVKHLGICLSKEPTDAATALFTAILQEVELQIALWSSFRSGFIGTTCVAKQMLASMVTYHATFIPVPEHLLTRMCRALHTLVAANRPVIGGTQAPLFPGKEACSRAAKNSGIALLDIRSQSRPSKPR